MPIFSVDNRFDWNGNDLVRNNKIILFNGRQNEEIELNNEKFSLKSVVNHHGPNSRSGHYTSYVRGSNNWISTNDARVNTVSRVSAE